MWGNESIMIKPNCINVIFSHTKLHILYTYTNWYFIPGLLISKMAIVVEPQLKNNFVKDNRDVKIKENKIVYVKGSKKKLIYLVANGKSF